MPSSDGQSLQTFDLLPNPPHQRTRLDDGHTFMTPGVVAEVVGH